MTYTPLKAHFPLTDTDKVPLKANIFQTARAANAQLLPLFSYMGAGDIIVCSAALASDGSKHRIGYFVHSNAVDEVAVSYGSSGRLRTGDVFVGPKTHGVGGDSEHAFFAVMTITQRELEEGEQPEAYAFQCEKCNTELYKYEFDSTELKNDITSGLTPLPTIQGTLEAVQIFNDSDDLRTCKSCGHVNPPFPFQSWGWHTYMFRTDIAKKAKAALSEVKQK